MKRHRGPIPLRVSAHGFAGIPGYKPDETHDSQSPIAIEQTFAQARTSDRLGMAIDEDRGSPRQVDGRVYSESGVPSRRADYFHVGNSGASSPALGVPDLRTPGSGIDGRSLGQMGLGHETIPTRVDGPVVAFFRPASVRIRQWLANLSIANMLRSDRRNARSGRGLIRSRMQSTSPAQALVELAIAFPIMMAILAGMLQGGLLLWGSNTLNQVVRDTGRYAATLDCTAAAVTAATTQFTTISTQAGGPWSSQTVTVTYKKPDGTVVTACPLDNTTSVWVDVIASAKVPYFFPIVPGGGNIGSSTTFRVEPQP